MLRLTGRYYRTIPIDETGYETETVELDPARTAFIGMHCWDIGWEMKWSSKRRPERCASVSWRLSRQQ